MLGAKGLLEVAITGVLGIDESEDGEKLGPNSGGLFIVGESRDGRIERWVDLERKHGLEDASDGAYMVDILLVGVGALFGGLGGVRRLAEGGDGGHVLVLGVFKVGHDLADAVEKPNAVAFSLLGSVVIGILNTALDGGTGLALDDFEKGILGARQFGAL